MRTVFVVHCEEMFRDKVPPDFPEKVEAAIKDFDRIVHLDSDIDCQGPWAELCYHINQRIHWSWGYEKEMHVDPAEDCELCSTNEFGCDCWIIEANGHEFTWIPDEVRSRPWMWGEVWVAGIFMGECLRDWCDVLDAVGIEYQLLQEAIY